MRDWEFGKVPGLEVQLMALIILCGAAIVYLGVPRYGLGFLIAYVILDLVFTLRWTDTENMRKKALYAAACWPLTIVLLYKIISREEGYRRERIVRDVMES